MADSSVAITPGSGANVDTRTQSNGDHREVVVLGDATTAYTATVGVSGGVAVRGAAVPGNSFTIGIGVTGALAAYDVSEAGNVTIYLKNATATPFTGVLVVRFECSDNGTDWAPLMMQRMDTGAISATHTIAPMALNSAVVLNAAMPGISYVRPVVTTGPTTAGVGITFMAGGMPFNPVVSQQTPARSPVVFYMAAPIAATATETLLALTSTRNGATVAAATQPAVVSAGKTLRITAFNFTYVATGTGAYAVARLRALPTTGVATTSPLYRQVVAGSAAAASANSVGAIITTPIDGLEFPAGSQIGVTLQGYSAAAAAAAGYGLVEVVGYEY